MVRSFLPQQVTWIAYRYAMMKVQNGLLDSTTDTQVPNTPAVHGDTLMEVLLEGATTAVENIVGEPLYPTYSYLRVYKKGDRLAPHIDRPSCEISMTLCLGYNVAGVDEPGYCWPMKVDNSMNYTGHDDKAMQPAEPESGKSVMLEPGDGLIYFGSELRHWRDVFPGDHQAQVFLHFVRRSGPHAGLKFDGRPLLGAVFTKPRHVATTPPDPAPRVTR